MTQALDKKTLAAFCGGFEKMAAANQPESEFVFSFSREFVEFARNFLKPEQKVLVEVQLIDVFNNLPLYFEAKEILHKGGHKLILDGVSPAALKMLNLKTLQPDMVKLFWEPLLEDEPFNPALKEIIETLGKEKVILAKCDSDKALKWGVSYGITAFQGPFMDDIEIANNMVRSRCPGAVGCTAQQCLKRRRLLSGALKAVLHPPRKFLKICCEEEDVLFNKTTPKLPEKVTEHSTFKRDTLILDYLAKIDAELPNYGVLYIFISANCKTRSLRRFNGRV